MHHLLSKAPASEMHFTFSHQKCHAKLFSQCWSVMLLLHNVVRLGQFFRTTFLNISIRLGQHSSILAFGRGHTIKQLPQGPGIIRPLHNPKPDQVYRSWWTLQASASQQELVLGLFHLIYLNGFRTSRAVLCNLKLCVTLGSVQKIL